ncbi:43829_t:CDS:2 [Gigaspora margarita]|uniref:43829_t:CDS:1 n=1 Tax=Gigaspora margarita TaxID=4874 RepID=A0ABN7VW60_GIGMA|nr:43829_t:CDS:2 [Gigaspora margarita]
MTQELSVSEFFELTFGSAPVELDLTSFVTEELTNELFFSIIKPSLGMLNPSGIFRNLFPYIFDTISRTVSLTRLVNCIQEFTEKYGGDDPSNVFQRLGDCTGRDFLIAFLDKIPEKSLRKILPMIVASNIPIPIFLPNDTIHSDKGLRILNGLYNVMTARKYHLFLSVNSPNHDLGVPFSKQLYKNFSNHREDFSSICNPGSIDISFHDASENHSRPPLAIAEVYFDETNSSTFCGVMKSLSQYAFYTVIHVSHNDFYDIEPGEKLITIINNIDVESYDNHRRRILILNTPELYLQPTFFKSFDHAYNDMNKNQFATLIAQSEFNCRADIFQASHCSNMIEMLKDKTRTENEINSEIVKFQDQQKNIVDHILALSYFAQIIRKNSICEMREFAQQVDTYFKTHLYDLAQEDHVGIHREEIKQKIEDRDITIHDFWREFIIMSKIKQWDDHLTILEAIYGLKVKELESGYRTWICESESIQILEGISLRTLDSDFLSAVLSKIMSDNKRQLIVLSVIGLESSGKSTLLNYLFHCGLSTSAGRCTKGAYMSYRHTIYSGKELDVLIIDSEGMGSTAQKYISRRTDFDKKMTLLALMCLQILIVNTKGLTRNISDILEVSSYHLDALSQRDSKPRINFVLRDMKDARSAQGPAFCDIRENLRKMFQEIPGCAFDMEDFMIVEGCSPA